MGLSAAVQWEVRTTGASTNGGGFKAGASGTDWSQQNAPQYSVTDAVANGTGTITSATAAFGTDVVGNIAYLAGAWYEITGRTNSTTITVDRNVSAASGLTLKIGGALDFVPTNAQINVQNKVWIRAGTYTLSTNVTWGHTDSTPYDTWYIGYNATRGDTLLNGTRPVISLTASGAGVTLGGAGTRIFNIDFDGTDTATAAVGGGAYSDRGAALYNCVIRRCTTYGVQSYISAFACRVTDMKAGATAGFWDLAIAVDCIADSNPCTGFAWSNNAANAKFIRCISANNTGGSSDGFGGGNALQGPFVFVNCIAYNNGQHGISIPAYPVGTVYNNILYGNGGYGLSVGGFTSANALASVAFGANAFGSNTSGARNGVTAGPGDVTLTSDPFTAGASLDFSLTATAGGGAACKAVGFPATVPVT